MNKNRKKSNSNKDQKSQGKFQYGDRPNKRYGQPKKDSSAKRVNLDNTREDKLKDKVEHEANSGKFNDIGWYSKNPELMKSACSYPIAPILGMPTYMREDGAANAVPGALVYYWDPNYGPAARGFTKQYTLLESANNPKNLILSPPPIAINQASDTTYSYIVHANSRNYSSNSADYFIMIMAGMQVFACIAAMTRAYGLIKRYREQSMYEPDAILNAMGFDASDLRKNLGNMWFQLNNLIDQSRQIWIPNVFPLMKRWYWLNSTLFKDAEGAYAQLYIPVQQHYYIYNETDIATGGFLGQAMLESALSVFDTRANAYKWAEWVELAQNLINALAKSEDRGIIYGDLLNAYTADNIFALPAVDSNYMIEPEYSLEVLMQVENMVTMNETNIAPNGLMQVENQLFPTYPTPPSGATAHVYVPSSKSMMNFHTAGDVTPEMIMLATRLTSLGAITASIPILKLPALALGNKTYQIAQGSGYIPYAAGSEVVNGFHVVKDLNLNKIKSLSHSEVGKSNQDMETQLSLMPFDWHPFWHMFLNAAGEQTPPAAFTVGTMGVKAIVEPMYYAGDFDKYTVLDEENVYKMHNTAIFSLFDVPQI